jgi:DNA polymerase I-like protein with 3'-5' exonuclease and polymerase domains
MIFVNTPDKIDSFKKWVKHVPLLGVDTETTGLDPHVAKVHLLQIGDEKEQWVFDCYRTGKDNITEVLNHLNTLPSIKIMHNAKFDFNMLRGNYGVEINNIYDTMLAAQLLNAGDKSYKSGLQDVLIRWLGIDLSKTVRHSFETHPVGKEFSEEQITYAALDVAYLPRLYKRFEEEIKLKNLQSIIKLENETLYVTADMEWYGIYIDKDKWLALESTARVEANNSRIKLDAFFDKMFDRNLFGELTLNLNSPQQLKPALEAVMKTKLESTDAKYLATIDHPVVKQLIDYRKWVKLISTYGAEFIKQNVSTVTDKLHTSFNQLGTDTGRYSSEGPNLQNIPAKQQYRDPFCVKDPINYRIVSADFSGQELRLLAHLSKEPLFLKALQEGKDLHAYSASLLFGIPYEEFFVYNQDGTLLKGSSKNKEDISDEDGFNKHMKKKYRNPAKKITFGLIYGMGPTKLANELGITLNEAKDLLKKYFSIFTKIKELMDLLEERVKQTRIAYSPLDGRYRDLSKNDWIDKRKISHAVNQAKNMPFQGCGASTTKLAMCLIRKELREKKYDARIVLTVHDEILVECHVSIVEEVKELVVRLMKQAFNNYANSVEMEISAAIGTHWIH